MNQNVQTKFQISFQNERPFARFDSMINWLIFICQRNRHSILLSTFLRLDEDHAGYLTRANLRYVFPEAILEDLFSAMQPKQPDQIDFDDFRIFFGKIMEREYNASNDSKSAAFRDFVYELLKVTILQ